MTRRSNHPFLHPTNGPQAPQAPHCTRDASAHDESSASARHEYQSWFAGSHEGNAQCVTPRTATTTTGFSPAQHAYRAASPSQECYGGAAQCGAGAQGGKQSCREDEGLLGDHVGSRESLYQPFEGSDISGPSSASYGTAQVCPAGVARSTRTKRSRRESRERKRRRVCPSAGAVPRWPHPPRCPSGVPPGSLQ